MFEDILEKFEEIIYAVVYKDGRTVISYTDSSGIILNSGHGRISVKI